MNCNSVKRIRLVSKICYIIKLIDIILLSKSSKNIFFSNLFVVKDPIAKASELEKKSYYFEIALSKLNRSVVTRITVSKIV